MSDNVMIVEMFKANSWACVTFMLMIVFLLFSFFGYLAWLNHKEDMARKGR